MFKNLKLMSVISWLIIVGLVICNVILIEQNLHLRETVEQQEIEKRVQIGETFNEFKTVDNNNNPISLVSAKPTKKVILFSSTSCPFCKKQNPYWIQLANRINSEKYEVFTLFNDREEPSKVEAYLRSYGYTNINNTVKPLFSNGETLQKYKLNGTPVTLVIDENGIVEKSWSGLWDKKIVTEVENYFRVTIN